MPSPYLLRKYAIANKIQADCTIDTSVFLRSTNCLDDLLQGKSCKLCGLHNAHRQPPSYIMNTLRQKSWSWGVSFRKASIPRLVFSFRPSRAHRKSRSPERPFSIGAPIFIWSGRISCICYAQDLPNALIVKPPRQSAVPFYRQAHRWGMSARIDRRKCRPIL